MRHESLDGESVFVIHDLLSPRECEELIARSEALGHVAAAVGDELIPQLRNNGRTFLEDESLADDLWRRAVPFLPRIEGAESCGLHERFRFYRYETAERFNIHMDGSVRRGEAEESRQTFMIYLSEVEEGGETNFYLTPGGVLEFAVRPSPGKALVFDHLRLHEGAAVRKGRKYVLRTDVMYPVDSQVV